jgi:hypothetical protein
MRVLVYGPSLGNAMRAFFNLILHAAFARPPQFTDSYFFEVQP